MKPDMLHEIIIEAAKQHAIDTGEDHEVGDLQDALSNALDMLTEEQCTVLHAKRLEQIDIGNGAVDGCECDNTHQQNDTVCSWCWNRGRRKWNDPEICDGCDGSGIRPWSNMQLHAGHAGPPPEGFVIVEQCDTCDKYKDDLAAAQAWGDEARWQDGNGTSQAIARPKGERAGGFFTITYEGKTHTIPAIIAPDMVMCGSKFLPGIKQPDLSKLGYSQDDVAHLAEVMPYCINEGGGHEEAINGHEVELSNGIAKWSYTPAPEGQKEGKR